MDLVTMEENEVKGRMVTIDIEKANIFALWIMVISGFLFLVPFFLIWFEKNNFRELFGSFGDWGITFLFAIVGIVVHELIHGLTWACYAKSGWKSISFGVMWKMLTPYCRRTRIFPWLTSTDPHDCISKGVDLHVCPKCCTFAPYFIKV